MTDWLDALDDDALFSYLDGAAKERGEWLAIEEGDGEWFAEFRRDTAVGAQAVALGVKAPDRRTAMAELADLVARG